MVTSGGDRRAWQQQTPGETGTDEGRGSENDSVNQAEREGLSSSSEWRPQRKKAVVSRKQEITLPRLRSRASAILGGYGRAQARGRQMAFGREGEQVLIASGVAGP